jgi:hypothetical protein
MDMTKPMNCYYVNTSNNTFLVGHQLMGQIKAKMFKKALLSGFRCVELDCWDGPGNTPIVTQGKTLCG